MSTHANQTYKNSSPIRQTVLEIKVRNHPGVMSHVCGLLTRRAYNIEGIICLPMQDNSLSRIWLLVNAEERLTQVIKQLAKLHDVINVQRHNVDNRICRRLELMFARNSN